VTVTISSLYVDANLSLGIDNWTYGDTTQDTQAHGHPAQDLVQVRAGHGLAPRAEPSGTGSVRSSDQAAEQGDVTRQVGSCRVPGDRRSEGVSATEVNEARRGCPERPRRVGQLSSNDARSLDILAAMNDDDSLRAAHGTHAQHPGGFSLHRDGPPLQTAGSYVPSTSVLRLRKPCGDYQAVSVLAARGFRRAPVLRPFAPHPGNLAAPQRPDQGRCPGPWRPGREASC